LKYVPLHTKSIQLTREVKYDDDVCECFVSLRMQSKE